VHKPFDNGNDNDNDNNNDFSPIMKSTSKSFFISILLTTSTSLVVAKPLYNEFASRIVGGNEASPGNYPYFTLIHIGDGKFCGGALIAPDIVLTAAHCESLLAEQVIIGAYGVNSLEKGAQTRFCDEWIPHPEYRKVDNKPINYEYNDFAVCKLDKPVVIDESKVRLELNEDASLPEDGDSLRVMGFGRTIEGGDTSEFLLDVTVPVVSNVKCNDISSNHTYILYNGAITENKLCAGFLEKGGKDTCQGDSGGALVSRTVRDNGLIVDTHVGVVSYGNGCAKIGYPGVYARTSSGSKWIKEASCDELQSVAPFCNNQAPPSPSDCDGSELIVVVTTDNNAKRISWSLQSKTEPETPILARKYFLNNYRNEHKLCLELDKEHTWVLFHQNGKCDGSCSYSLTLDGKELLLNDKFDIRNQVSKTFRTSVSKSPTNTPTKMPTNTPTKMPSKMPTKIPTKMPTKMPTKIQTQTSGIPTKNPKKNKSLDKANRTKQAKKKLKANMVTDPTGLPDTTEGSEKGTRGSSTKETKTGKSSKEETRANNVFSTTESKSEKDAK